MLRGQLTGAHLRRMSRRRRAEVFAELCEIVEEVVEMIKADGEPLPPPTVGRDFAKAPPMAAE